MKTATHLAKLLPLAGALLCAATAPALAASDETIAPYQARFGRAQPVIAVIGESSGTELSDYVIPYAVLSRSGAAEVLSLASRPGRLQMTPAPLQIDPQATITQFDARFPDGADYIIVPKVGKDKDSRLLAWLRDQNKKGATIVSICDGALAVAATGLLKGHRATAHWATEERRAKAYPDTDWVANKRYVADRRFVSSSGISAAIPTSLALVEAIAGRARAGALAAELGVSDWSSRHDSSVFQPGYGQNAKALAAIGGGRWSGTSTGIGVPLGAGVDDIALAFTLDAYSRTGSSVALAVSASAAPVRTRDGLMIVPDRVAGAGDAPAIMLPPFDAAPAAHWIDKALAGIARRYGPDAAFGVALAFEYPGYKNEGN
ncbi:DJ-1/PfpI family protein [Massilia glaciei]|nr:DJ-1/PfpI family protein [Massilia glaciei]